MKNTYLLLSLAFLVFFFSAASFLQATAPNHHTSFSYSVTSTAVITKVTYNPDQSPLVEKYIDSCLQPVVVFGDKHKANKEVQITSSELNYTVKGSPGSLTMKALKINNSASSLKKLKDIFEGLKSVIKPN
jgi:hypothetical protein